MKQHNHKVSPNVKLAPMLSSLTFPNHNYSNPPILLLAPKLLNPINRKRLLKPKPLNPSTPQYPTQSPLKKIVTIYTPELVTLGVDLH